MVGFLGQVFPKFVLKSYFINYGLLKKKKKGNPTPQIKFLVPFLVSKSLQEMDHLAALYELTYGQAKYALHKCILAPTNTSIALTLQLLKLSDAGYILFDSELPCLFFFFSINCSKWIFC